jgi:hypothetical protein
MSAHARERRHFSWLNDSPDFRAAIVLRSTAMYHEHGRGCWFGSAIADDGRLMSISYVTVAQLREEEDILEDLIEVVEGYIPSSPAIAGG